MSYPQFNIWKHLEEHGNLKARVAALEARQRATDATLTTLQATRNKALGAYGALLLVGSVAGVLGAIVTRVFFH